MPTTPWKSFGQAEPDREYLVLLSYLPLNRARDIPRFLIYTLRIMRQLKQSEGLIGYSLRAQLLSKRFWTLSAWRNEAAMLKFVRAAPHSSTMTDLATKMGATNFVRWRVTGADLPVRWIDALRRRPTA